MAVDPSSLALALGYPAAAQLQPAIQPSQPIPLVLQSPPATNFNHYLRPQLQKQPPQALSQQRSMVCKSIAADGHLREWR
jgi:hypothetical protein